jgi:hypothetical protein
LADYLDNPRDLPGGLGAEYGRKTDQFDTKIDTMREDPE